LNEFSNVTFSGFQSFPSISAVSACVLPVQTCRLFFSCYKLYNHERNVKPIQVFCFSLVEQDMVTATRDLSQSGTAIMERYRKLELSTGTMKPISFRPCSCPSISKNVLARQKFNFTPTSTTKAFLSCRTQTHKGSEHVMQFLKKISQGFY
jgi:hypothetical protein